MCAFTIMAYSTDLMCCCLHAFFSICNILLIHYHMLFAIFCITWLFRRASSLRLLPIALLPFSMHLQIISSRCWRRYSVRVNWHDDDDEKNVYYNILDMNRACCDKIQCYFLCSQCSSDFTHNSNSRRYPGLHCHLPSLLNVILCTIDQQNLRYNPRNPIFFTEKE